MQLWDQIVTTLGTRTSDGSPPSCCVYICHLDEWKQYK